MDFCVESEETVERMFMIERRHADEHIPSPVTLRGGAPH